MKCFVCNKEIKSTKDMFLDNIQQTVLCNEHANPPIKYSNNSEYAFVNNFECNDCGRKFSSLDSSPNCPYCLGRHCIKVE